MTRIIDTITANIAESTKQEIVDHNGGFMTQEVSSFLHKLVLLAERSILELAVETGQVYEGHLAELNQLIAQRAILSMLLHISTGQLLQLAKDANDAGDSANTANQIELN